MGQGIDLRTEDDLTNPAEQDPSLCLAADASQDNPVYVLQHPLAAQLAAAALEWPWPGGDRSGMTAAALTRLQQRLAACECAGAYWLLIGHRAWQPDNRIFRHRFKDVAAGLAERGAVVASSAATASAVFACANGVKAAALLRLDNLEAATTMTVASLLRGDWACELIVGPETAARALFAVFASPDWHQQGRAPAAALIELLVRHPMLAFLPLGWFDDAEVGCALLGQRALLGRVFPQLLASA